MNDKIVCPHCKHVQDEPECWCDHVTYWGDEGDKECDCEDCEKTFMVTEHVSRWFKCYVREPCKADMEKKT